MDGLNDGLELEEDLGSLEGDAVNRVFDHPEPGQVPDLNPETQIITLVTNNVNDLNLLRSDIEDKGGMDQGFALECANLMDYFINPRQPLAMFTKIPTQTNYRITLEAIEAEKVSLVNRMIEVIKALLDKVIAWLKDAWEKMASDKMKARAAEAKEYFTQRSSENQANLTRLQTAYGDPKSATDRVTRLASDKTAPEFRTYLESLEEKLMDGSDRLNNLYQQLNSSDMLYHLVTDSDVYGQVMKISLHVEAILVSMRQVDEQVMRDFMDLKEDPQALELKAKGVLASLRKLAGQYGATTFHDHELLVKNNLRHREGEITPKTHPLNRIYTRVAKSFRGFSDDEFMRSIRAAIDQLQAIRKKFDDVTNNTRLGAKERGQNNYGFVTELYKAIYGEIRGVTTILTLANQLYYDWTLVAHVLNNYTKDFHARVSVHLNSLDEGSRKLIMEYFGVPINKTDK